jgi:hypothetical protein
MWSNSKCNNNLYVAMQVAGVSSSTCGAGCRLADATGALGLTDADRELYKACTAGTAPDGTACSDEERGCYKCFCYKAITDGMLRYAFANFAGQECACTVWHWLFTAPSSGQDYLLP